MHQIDVILSDVVEEGVFDEFRSSGTVVRVQFEHFFYEIFDYLFVREIFDPTVHDKLIPLGYFGQILTYLLNLGIWSIRTGLKGTTFLK
jgi:hypothetical protein